MDTSEILSLPQNPSALAKLDEVPWAPTSLELLLWVPRPTFLCTLPVQVPACLDVRQ